MVSLLSGGNWWRLSLGVLKIFCSLTDRSGVATRRPAEMFCWFHRYEIVGAHLLIAFTLMTMVVGTMNVVEKIIADVGDFGAPFSCHEYVVSNATCNTTRPVDPT